MRLLPTIFLPIMLTVSSVAQHGALTVPRNVGQLARQANTIVHGHVLSVRVEPHPQLSNLSTVVVTLRVVETLKGASAPSFTFRQFIWDLRDKDNAAGYKKGQELLLLLNPTSAYGLTSPAGMDQGRFRIIHDNKGNVSARNGLNNVGLFADMSAGKQARAQLPPGLSTLISQHRAGPVSLKDLEEVIRQFSGAGK